MSISSFLPQIPYFTMLDYFMWAFIYFISLVALENIAWPAAVCTNLRAKLDQSKETNLMGALIALLAFIFGVMYAIVYCIRDFNEKELLKLRKEGVVTTVQGE